MKKEGDKRDVVYFSAGDRLGGQTTVRKGNRLKLNETKKKPRSCNKREGEEKYYKNSRGALKVEAAA